MDWYDDRFLEAEIDDMFANEQAYLLRTQGGRKSRLWRDLGDGCYQKQKMIPGPEWSDEDI